MLEREEIYQRVWGYTMVRGDRSVDVFVRKLRHKLEQLSPVWRYVHTHFGVGYRFAAERVGQPAAPAPGSRPRPSGSGGPVAPERVGDSLTRPSGRWTSGRAGAGTAAAGARWPPGVRLEDHEPGHGPQHRDHPRDRGIVVIDPGGGTGANVAIQTPRSRSLRARAGSPGGCTDEHRITLYALGDARRAALYGAIVVAALTLTATSRLWQTSGGAVAWLVLLGGSAYAVFAVVWCARKY